MAAITGLFVPRNQRHFGAKVAAQILPFYCRSFFQRSNQKKCYKHVALELGDKRTLFVCFERVYGGYTVGNGDFLATRF